MTMTSDELPAPIQTRWVAIAGGACSGKTTIAERLRETLGWRLIPDHGRHVFQEAVEAGLSTEHFADNPLYYQKKIARRYLKDCRAHGVREPLISDYGLPCVYAWCRAKGIDPMEDLVRGCDEWRYDKVFMLSPLPMQLDGIREAAASLQNRVLKEMSKAYSYFGYDVIKVPTFEGDIETSISKRLAFILSHIDSAARDLSDQSLFTAPDGREVA